MVRNNRKHSRKPRTNKIETMYYNTTNETKETVKKFKKKNSGQDKNILQLITAKNKISYKYTFSPKSIYQEYKLCYGKSILIGSIRRSINTLKNLELIEETGKRVQGLYGRTELQYKLSEKPL
jgi:hypothetical protein